MSIPAQPPPDRQADNKNVVALNEEVPKLKQEPGVALGSNLPTDDKPELCAFVRSMAWLQVRPTRVQEHQEALRGQLKILIDENGDVLGRKIQRKRMVEPYEIAIRTVVSVIFWTVR